MNEPTTKAGLLAAIEREREDWATLLAEVGQERMEIPGAMGEWTFKDAIAHLTAWRIRSHVDRFEAAARGQTPPANATWQEEDEGDVDAINDAIYMENRDRPLSNVLTDSDASIRRLAAAIAAIPEADLFDPGRYPWAGGDPLVPAAYDVSFGHLHEEHEPDIRAWLARLPPRR